jgi:hypothetical protein
VANEHNVAVPDGTLGRYNVVGREAVLAWRGRSDPVTFRA